MNDRDELAELIAVTKYPRLVPAWEERKDSNPVKYFSRKQADAVLAAGYRKTRTITTAEALDVLPVNTAIIGTSTSPKHWSGTPYVKLSDTTWHDYGNGYSVGSADIRLPATITFAPEAEEA